MASFHVLNSKNVTAAEAAHSKVSRPINWATTSVLNPLNGNTTFLPLDKIFAIYIIKPVLSAAHILISNKVLP
jgi:hypothetical protein